MITVIVYGFTAIKRFTRYSKSSKCCLYATTTQANTQYCRHANGREQQVTEQLLLNVLPAPVAERLKLRADLVAEGPPAVIADRFEDVSVQFADLVQFTRFSPSMGPERLVAVLNEIFADFDNIADRRGLEKIKTIGDAYMGAAGLPVPAADPAVQAAHMALDMIASLDRFNQRSGHGLQRGRLAEPFLFEERGLITARGIGDVRTWLLAGRTTDAPA